MNDDLDFEMEVVEDDELEDLGATPDEENQTANTRVSSDEIGTDRVDGGTEKESSSGSIQLGPKELEVPTHWKVTTFEEANVSDKPIGYGVVKPGPYVEDGIPLIRITDVVDGKLSGEEDFHRISEELDEKYSRSRLQGGELLISIQGTIGEVVVVPPELSEANISRTLARITLSEDVNTHWAKYFLESKEAQDYMTVVSSGSTRASYNIGDIRKTKLSLPPLPEQRKIASVLYTVDQAIQKTEAIIEQAKRVKRGLMQDFFRTGLVENRDLEETRIGEIPANWAVVNAGEHLNLVSGAHVKAEHVTTNQSLEPYITGPEDFDLRSIEVSKYTDEPSKFCEPGDILVTVKGSGCGKTAIADRRVCISRQLKALQTDGSLDRDFLFYYLRFKQNLLETLSEGSAIPGLSNSHLLKLDVPLPPVKEQREVGRRLSRVDDLIEKNLGYTNHLRRLKEGLMQDLLTGEVRTADKAIGVVDEVEFHE